MTDFETCFYPVPLQLSPRMLLNYLIGLLRNILTGGFETTDFPLPAILRNSQPQPITNGVSIVITKHEGKTRKAPSSLFEKN